MKEETQNNMLPVLLAMALGVVIGANWDKIKKNFGPVLATLEKQYGNMSFATLGALATQKEKIEDMFATRKEHKANIKSNLKSKMKRRSKA